MPQTPKIWGRGTISWLPYLFLFLCSLALPVLAQTAPSILLYSPKNYANRVSLTETLTLTFSQSIERVSGSTGTIRTVSNNVVVEEWPCDPASPGTNIFISGAQLTITPSVLRTELTQYSVLIDPTCLRSATTTTPFPGITGLAGWTFTTGDFSPPVVLSLSPAAGATNVDSRTSLKMQFDSVVRALSGSTAQIQVRRSSDNTVLCAIECVEGGSFAGSGSNTLTLTCAAALPDMTAVTVVVPSLCITDLYDNALPSVPGWAFTTGDYTPPTLTAQTPANLATGVATSQVVSFTLNEAVSPGNGHVALRRVKDGSEVLRVNAPDLLITAGRTVSITPPTGGWPDGVRLAVVVSGDALKDGNGNYFPGLQDTDWAFTTIDVSPPVPVTFSPAPGSVNAPVRGDLTITFNEVIVRGGSNGRIVIRKSTGDAILDSIDVASSSVEGWGTATLRISPTGFLPDATLLYVTVPAGVIVDLSGNAYGGIALKSEWAFTTGDSTAPTALVLSPAVQATNVRPDAILSIQFTEAVRTLANGTIKVMNRDTGALLETIEASAATSSGSVLLSWPHARWPSLTTIAVEVAGNAIEDLAGNAFLGTGPTTEVDWVFSTGDWDAPVFATLDPPLMTREVPLNKVLSVTFNEPVSLGTGNIYLHTYQDEYYHNVDSATLQLVDTIAVTDVTRVTLTSPTTLTFTQASLQANRIVFVTMDAGVVKDTSVNANALVGYTSPAVWNFTTIDTLPPVVTSVVPANGAAGVPITQPLNITFNEPVTATSGVIEIRSAVSNAVLVSVPLTDARVTGRGTRSLVVDMSVAPLLPYEATVYVHIAASTIRDLSSAPNYFAGLLTPTAWSWTTGDITPPAIRTLSPAHMSTTAAKDTALNITFTEPVFAGTAGTFTLYRYVDNAVVRVFPLGGDAMTGLGTATLSLVPGLLLDGETWYYVIATPGVVVDVSGNAFAGIADATVWRFRTLDVTPPTLIATTPATDSVLVPTATALRLFFSEAVIPAAANSGAGLVSVYAYDLNTGECDVLHSTYRANQFSGAASSVLSVQPRPLLGSLTRYCVLIAPDAFTDTSGLPFAGVQVPATWSFTTRDDAPPAIVSLSPAAGALAVPLATTTFLITFDKPVYTYSGTVLLRTTADAAVVASLSSVSTAIQGNGTTILSLTWPVSALTAATTYSVTFPSTFFRDQYFNFHPGFQTLTQWSFSSFDNVPPTLVSTQPATNATSVGLTDPLVLVFSKPVLLAEPTAALTLHLFSSGAAVETVTLGAAAVVGWGTTTLTVARTVVLTDLTKYYVTLPVGAIADHSGNKFAGLLGSGAWYFTTGDISLPTFVALSPAPGATLVPTASKLVLTFNKAVWPVSAPAGFYYLAVHNAADDSVVSRVDLTTLTALEGTGTATITVTPPAPLPELATLYVLVTAGGLRDSAARPFAGIADTTTWSFDTADDSAPRLVSSTPALAATGVPATSTLTMVFSEPVWVGTGAISIMRAGDNAVLASYTDLSVLTGEGTNTITAPSLLSLPSATQVYVLVADTVFYDRVGNPFPGLSSPSGWYFTIADTTPPVLLAVKPANGAVNVSTATHLWLYFDEPVSYGTGEVCVHAASDGSVLYCIAANSGRLTQTSFAGQHTVDVDTTGFTLPDKTEVYVTVAATAFTDLAGNAFGGVSDPTAWRFTSGDFTPPAPAVLVPAHDSVAASTTAPFTVTFDEDVQWISGLTVTPPTVTGNATVYRYNTAAAAWVVVQTIPISSTSTVTTLVGRTLTIAHAALVDLTRYTVTVSAGLVADAAGNKWAGFSAPGQWAFTSADTTPPTITRVAPAVAAQTVVALPTYTLTFSEDVLLGSGTPAPALSVWRAADGVLVESIDVASGRVALVVGSGSSSGAANTVTVQPSVPLADLTQYYITVSPTFVTDSAGNAFAGLSGASQWYFRTKDNTPPTLVVRTPALNDARATTSGPMVLTFGEPVAVRAAASALRDTLYLYERVSGAFTPIPLYPVTVNGTSQSYVSGTGTATLAFTYPTPLREGVEYYVMLAPGAITDMAGNPFAGFGSIADYVFTTGYFSAPTIVALAPAHNSTAVALAAPLVLTFSAPVVVGTGVITVTSTSSGTIIASFDVASASELTGSGTAIITVTPSTPWPDSLTVTVEVAAGAFKDAHGNPFAGLGYGQWLFTLVDITPPQVALYSPAIASTSAGVSGQYHLRFTEPVKVNTGASSAGGGIHFYTGHDAATGTLVASVACTVTQGGAVVPNSNALSVTDDKLAILLPVRLTDTSPYHVRVDADCITDLAGNAFPGILDAKWYFLTGDFTGPTLTGHVPAHLATQVAVDAPLTLTFNEPVQLPVRGPGYLRFYAPGSGVLAKAVPLSAATTTGLGTTTLSVAINAAPPLVHSTRYCVVIDAGALADAAGNAFAGIGLDTGNGCSSWSFTTVDLTPPRITALTPANNTDDAAASPTLVLTFDEPVQLTGTGVLTLRAGSATGTVLHTLSFTGLPVDPADTSALSAWATVAGTNTLSLHLSAALQEYQWVYVHVTTGAAAPITDVYGNAFAGFDSGLPYAAGKWLFRVGDVRPPAYTALSPAIGSAGVAIYSALSITFDEVVLPMPIALAAALQPSVNITGAATATEQAQLLGMCVEVRRAADHGLLQRLCPTDSRITEYDAVAAPNTLTFAPLDPLPAATALYVLVPAYTAVDRANNPFPGISEGVWTFTTQTPPKFQYKYALHTVTADGSRMLSNPIVAEVMPAAGPVQGCSSPQQYSLPAGVAFDASSGTLRGNPTVPTAPLQLTVTCSNGGGSYTATTTLHVVAAAPPPFTYSLAASGYSWEVTAQGDMHPLAQAYVDADTGADTVVHPDAAASALTAMVPEWTFTTNTKITPLIPQALATAAPDGLLYGTATTYTISPALPRGLTLDPTTGSISGTPRSTTTGQTTNTVTATNSGGMTAVAQLKLTVLQGPLRVGVPAHVSPAQLAVLTEAFAAAATELGVSASAVRVTGDPAAALEAGDADVALLEAPQLYLNWRRYGHVALAVLNVDTTLDYAADGTGAVSSVRTGGIIAAGIAAFDNRPRSTAMYAVAVAPTAVSTLASLAGATVSGAVTGGGRVCAGNWGSGHLLGSLAWAASSSSAAAVLQAAAPMPTPSTAASPVGLSLAELHSASLETCSSPVTRMLDALAPRVCAPPVTNLGSLAAWSATHTHADAAAEVYPHASSAGRCEACAGKGAQRCEAGAAAGTAWGTVQGVADGVCGAAFTYKHMPAYLCGRAGKQRRWCLSRNKAAGSLSALGFGILAEQLDMVNKGAGADAAVVVPTPVFACGSGVSDAMLATMQGILANAFTRAQGRYAHALEYLFPSASAVTAAATATTGTFALAPTAAASSGVFTGLHAATYAHLSQGSFAHVLEQLPGVMATVACAAQGICVHGRHTLQLDALGRIASHSVQSLASAPTATAGATADSVAVARTTTGAVAATSLTVTYPPRQCSLSRIGDATYPVRIGAGSVLLSGDVALVQEHTQAATEALAGDAALSLNVVGTAGLHAAAKNTLTTATTTAADIVVSDDALTKVILPASVVDVYRGAADIVVVDSTTAYLAHRQLGLIAIAAEAAAPVTHTFSFARVADVLALATGADGGDGTGVDALVAGTTAEQVLTVTPASTTGASAASAAQSLAANVAYVALHRVGDDMTGIPGPFVRGTVPTALSLANKRVCFPSLEVATWSAIALGPGSATGGQGFHTCSGALTQHIRSSFAAVCAPPLEEGGAGVCDLCLSEDAPSPITQGWASNGTAVTSRSTTAPVRGCSRLNRYAGEAGALRGVAERACEVAIVRNDTASAVCGRSWSQRMAAQGSYALSETADTSTDADVPAWCSLLGDLQQTPLSSLNSNAGWTRGAVLMTRPDALSARGLDAVAAWAALANRRADALHGLMPGAGGVAVCQRCNHQQWTQALLQPTSERLEAAPLFSEFSNCYGDAAAVNTYACLSSWDTQCANVPTFTAAAAAKASQVPQEGKQAAMPLNTQFGNGGAVAPLALPLLLALLLAMMAAL